MKDILTEDACNDTYGRTRMYQALTLKQLENVDIPSERTVYRVMEEIGINHHPKRKPNGITKADREARKSENEHSRILKRLEAPISSLGGCTFGVYLLHVYIKGNPKLNHFLWHIFQEKIHVPSMVYAFILCGVVFVCGYTITLILKQIPFIRRLVS